MGDFIKWLLRSWYPAIITVCGIAVLSVIKVETPTLILSTSDLLKHFTAYFALSILIHFPLQYKTQMGQVTRAIFIVLICSAYGVVMEFLQDFIPGRDCDVLDAVANSLGAIIGQVVVYVKERFEDKHA